VAKILFGIGAGLLSALVSCVLAYVVGVSVIAADLKEFFPTLLAAATVLPLMLILFVLLPSLVIGLLVGATIGIGTKFSSRVYVVGAAAGVLFSVAVFSVLLPLWIAHAPNDFLGIISSPMLAGSYGLVLGLLAARLQKYAPSK
jgi:hypothetical protein